MRYEKTTNRTGVIIVEFSRRSTNARLADDSIPLFPKPLPFSLTILAPLLPEFAKFLERAWQAGAGPIEQRQDRQQQYQQFEPVLNCNSSFH